MATLFRSSILAAALFCISWSLPLDKSFSLDEKTVALALDKVPTIYVHKGLRYLTELGYLPAVDTRSRTEGQRKVKDIVNALKLLQKFAGLKITGLLDDATIKLMNTSRCSMPDFGPSDRARRRRRYALQGTRWTKTDLTFRIENYTPDLPRNDVHRTIERALNMWAEVTPLTFTEITAGQADIMIKFERGYHQDAYPFDGEGGFLAHAFFPHNNEGISGDTHFDEDEHWTIESGQGTDLLWVAVHEFGHALGLDHSSVVGSIMFPWYQGYNPDFKLTEDDIRGIHQLYGMPKMIRHTMKPEATMPTMSSHGPHPCTVQPEVAFISEDKTYFFAGDFYLRIGDNSGLEEGPLRISEKWHELPGHIDAAYTRPDGITVFYKGDSFWEYRGDEIQRGPRPISELGLPGEMAGMDAAFIWGANSKTYFFKGSQYWRYDDSAKMIEDGYPKAIGENWKGVPDNIDAVFKWKNGRTYFIKGGEYYGLDDSNVEVFDYYPREVARWWIGCSETDIERARSSAAVVASSLISIGSVLLLMLVRVV